MIYEETYLSRTQMDENNRESIESEQCIRISEAMSMHLLRLRCGSKPFLMVYKAFWLIARGLGSFAWRSIRSNIEIRVYARCVLPYDVCAGESSENSKQIAICGG